MPESEYSSDDLSGQWIDPVDGDTAYFRRIGNRVVGYYDYGAGDRKTGFYRGELNGSKLNYQWKWIDSDLEGEGSMLVSADGNTISGSWWFSENPNEKEKVQYRRISNEMPKWLTEDDFSSHLKYLKTGTV